MKPILIILQLFFLCCLLKVAIMIKQIYYTVMVKYPAIQLLQQNFPLMYLPVMNVSCNTGGCHSTIDAAGGVILDTYAGVKAQVANGRLMGSINQTGSFSAMPKGAAKLNSCSITRIQQWINSGTPNN